MALPKFITQREGLIRTASTVALAIIAVRSFIKGKQLRGLLAAGGAVAVGAAGSTLEPTPLEVEQEAESTTEVGEAESTTEVGEAETVTEADGLECTICNEPIVVGEARRPNAVDEIVHEACLNSPE